MCHLLPRQAGFDRAEECRGIPRDELRALDYELMRAGGRAPQLRRIHDAVRALSLSSTPAFRDSAPSPSPSAETASSVDSPQPPARDAARRRSSDVGRGRGGGDAGGRGGDGADDRRAVPEAPDPWPNRPPASGGATPATRRRGGSADQSTSQSLAEDGSSASLFLPIATPLPLDHILRAPPRQPPPPSRESAAATKAARAGDPDRTDRQTDASSREEDERGGGSSGAQWVRYKQLPRTSSAPASIAAYW